MYRWCPHLLAADAQRLGDDLDESAVAQTQLLVSQFSTHLSSQVLTHHLDGVTHTNVIFFIIIIIMIYDTDT